MCTNQQLLIKKWWLLDMWNSSERVNEDKTFGICVNKQESFWKKKKKIWNWFERGRITLKMMIIKHLEFMWKSKCYFEKMMIIRHQEIVWWTSVILKIIMVRHLEFVWMNEWHFEKKKEENLEFVWTSKSQFDKRWWLDIWNSHVRACVILKKKWWFDI